MDEMDPCDRTSEAKAEHQWAGFRSGVLASKDAIESELRSGEHDRP